MNRPGLLLLDKPVGPTSHDMVALVRRELGIRRVGHTGTLDPFASGQLLICLGWATRLAEYFHVLPKTYEATIVLGDGRDTDDRTGEQIASSEAWKDLDFANVEEGLRQFLGSSDQMPPDYSARQLDGRRAYQAAREGDPLKLAARPIEVSEIRLLEWSPPRVDAVLTVSTGTYIRAIARDLGEALGCHGHLSALRRTRIGPFTLENASKPGSLGQGDPRIVSPLEAVGWMPRRILNGAEVADISTGKAVPAADVQTGVPVALVADGELAAIGFRDGDLLRPSKVFRGV